MLFTRRQGHEGMLIPVDFELLVLIMQPTNQTNSFLFEVCWRFCSAGWTRSALCSARHCLKYTAANMSGAYLLQPVAMKFEKCVQHLLGTRRKLWKDRKEKKKRHRKKFCKAGLLRKKIQSDRIPAGRMNNVFSITCCASMYITCKGCASSTNTLSSVVTALFLYIQIPGGNNCLLIPVLTAAQWIHSPHRYLLLTSQANF